MINMHAGEINAMQGDKLMEKRSKRSPLRKSESVVMNIKRFKLWS